MRHSRLAALGLMAALAFSIPIAANAYTAPLPDPNVGQYETYALTNLTTDQTVADQHNAVLRDDIGIATAYAEDLGLTNDWIITTNHDAVALSATNLPGGPSDNALNANTDSPQIDGSGIAHNYTDWTISVRNTTTSAVVVSGTSSASAGLSLGLYDNYDGSYSNGLADDDWHSANAGYFVLMPDDGVCCITCLCVVDPPVRA